MDDLTDKEKDNLNRGLKQDHPNKNLNTFGKHMSSEKKTMIVTSIVSVILIASAGILIIFFPSEDAYDPVTDKIILGYNADGYFCKVVNKDIFLPVELCKDQMKSEQGGT